MLEHVTVDVTIRIQITVGLPVLARVTNQPYAVCLTVLLMATGEPGQNGRIVRAIVAWQPDIVLVPALILHPHMAGGVARERLKNIVTANWVIVLVSMVCLFIHSNVQHFIIVKFNY